MTVPDPAADDVARLPTDGPSPRGIALDAGPPRLTLVISALVAGGAERVMTELANHWVSVGWPVSLIHYGKPGTAPAYPLDPRVTEVPLGLQRDSRNWIEAIVNNLHRIRTLRRAIRSTKPDVVLSFMANVLTIFSTVGSRTPVIVSERTTWAGESSWPWRFLRAIAYRRAAFVVVLSPEAIADLPANLRGRARIVPSPLPAQFVAIEPSRPQAGSSRSNGEPTIMGMGRLSPEKGFDLLIEAFARIRHARPGARLVIWGEGDDRSHLERLRADLDLTECVELPGNTDHPERDLRAATVFVLSSRREGLPMALIEAMSLGLAVVSFDCHHGPRDVIQDGVDGVLVPPEDVDALVAAINGLLDDDARRATLAHRAIRVRDRYAIGPVASEWESLFVAAMRSG